MLLFWKWCVHSAKFQFKMKYILYCVAVALTISDVDKFNQSISIFRLISFNTAFIVKE